MATNLLDLVGSQLTGGVVSRIAGVLGEPETRTRAAIDNALPAVLAGLANRGATPEGAAAVMDLLKKNGLDTRGLTRLASAVQEPEGMASLVKAGGPLLEGILGPHVGAVAHWLSSAAGIPRAASASLLSLLLLVVLGTAHRLLGGSLNAASLASLLNEQRDFLQESLPDGLASALVFSDSTAEAHATRAERPGPTFGLEPAMARPSWLRWALLVLAILVLVLLWKVFSTPQEEPVAQDASASATLPPAVPAPVRAELGPFVATKLPNGVGLRIPSHGVESKLIAFLADPGRKVDAATGFSFDRLEFEGGSPSLKLSSQEQLRNLAAILKAYPQVSLRLDGYTVDTGDEAHNRELSRECAISTLNEIVQLGIDPERLDAEGHGEPTPVADAAQEGQARHPRIDVRVTKK